MKTILSALMVLLVVNTSNGQTTDKQGVEKACMNYIEGFYEGDQEKLKASLQPTLNKFGFWKNKETGEYKQQNYMTFEKALGYAKNVKEKKQFAKADAPKKVQKCVKKPLQ